MIWALQTAELWVARPVAVDGVRCAQEALTRVRLVAGASHGEHETARCSVIRIDAVLVEAYDGGDRVTRSPPGTTLAQHRPRLAAVGVANR